MPTVALIGPDGAGKTTIARRLLQSFPRPMKYLYMGVSIQSSNVALPTSRLILYLKRRAHARSAARAGKPAIEAVSNHELENRDVRRGKAAAAARLLYRLAEECYRQFVSWAYQLRGYIVLYDRHFLFEFATQSVERPAHQHRLSDRLHLWFLNHVYPKPSLVVFLDAPPEVLLQRKNEGTLSHLQRERRAYIEKGRQTANFFRIDATQSEDRVYAEVSQLLGRLGTGKRRRVDVKTIREGES